MEWTSIEHQSRKLEPVWKRKNGAAFVELTFPLLTCNENNNWSLKVEVFLMKIYFYCEFDSKKKMEGIQYKSKRQIRVYLGIKH